MDISQTSVSSDLKKQLIDYCYPLIGCIQETHNDLGPGMPEYIYQEGLVIALREKGLQPIKEYQHHPIFRDKELESYLKMDVMVPMPKGNVVIECKAIKELSFKEQYQLWGYLRGTGFPIGILVNFGTWPKAQVHRYYFDHKTCTIHAF